MRTLKFLLVIPLMIPGVLLWVLGLLLIAVAAVVSGNPQWVDTALGNYQNREDNNA